MPALSTGGNYTTEALEDKMSALEGAESTLFLASGMCASTVLFMALVPKGGLIVTTTDCFIEKFLVPNMGVKATVIDPADVGGAPPPPLRALITRRYKLLRLIFRQDDKRRMKSDVITLGPTETVWQWRELDEDGAGIRQLFTKTGSLYNSVTSNGVSMFSGDGFLCWIREGRGMILFDLNKEVFRWVKFPEEMDIIDSRMMVPRVLINKEDHLSIYLYVFPSSPDIDCEFFVLEDEKSNVWRKQILELKGGLVKENYYLGAANGSPISSSQPAIMLMSSCSRWDGRSDVYWSNGKRMWRFWVGQLPFSMKSFDRGKLRKEDATQGFTGRLSCLLDSNVLYLPLKDVLNGNGLV